MESGGGNRPMAARGDSLAADRRVAGTMYAINIADLDELGAAGGDTLIQMLLAGVLCSADSPHVWIDPNRFDTGAVVLDGPAVADEERVLAAIEVLQLISKRLMGRPIRCYKRGPRGGWGKVKLSD